MNYNILWVLTSLVTLQGIFHAKKWGPAIVFLVQIHIAFFLFGFKMKFLLISVLILCFMVLGSVAQKNSELSEL